MVFANFVEIFVHAAVITLAVRLAKAITTLQMIHANHAEIIALAALIKHYARFAIRAILPLAMDLASCVEITA